MLCCRDKARQLFSDGLQMALPEVPGGDVAFASAEVECAMYASCGGVTKDYRTMTRRLSFNIKDPKNPDLRRRVLAGDVTGKTAP
jgi:transcription elongation factor S-II